MTNVITRHLNKEHLKRHIKSKFSCDQCDYRVANRTHLLTHIQVKHEGVKILCSLCDSKFADKYSSYVLYHIDILFTYLLFLIKCVCSNSSEEVLQLFL